MRLLGVTTLTYEYKGDGDRVEQFVDGVRTEYVLDTASPLTRVLAETTGTDTITYLHGLGLVAQSDGASTEYFANDGLGSVRQLVDPVGEVLLAQTYDPYGSLYASAGVDSTAFGYAGEQEDANGLIFLRARYYSPSMGRFLNMDPSRQEMNPYVYGGNNPVMFTDPSGLFPNLYGVNIVKILPGELFTKMKELFRGSTQFYGVHAVLRNLDVINDASHRYDLDPALLAAVIDWESNAAERLFTNHAKVFDDDILKVLVSDLDLWKYIFTGESSVGVGQVRIDRALYLEARSRVQKQAPRIWILLPKPGPLPPPGPTVVVSWSRLNRSVEIALTMSISEPGAIEYAAANLSDAQEIIKKSGYLYLSEENITALTIIAYNKGQEEVSKALWQATDCKDIMHMLFEPYLVNQVGPRYIMWKDFFNGPR